MKNIQKILFLFLILASFTANAQSRFPITQNIGSKINQIHVPGLLVTDSGFVLRSYLDTIAANVAQLKFNGSLIKVDSSLYLYNIDKWVKVSIKNVVIDTLPLSIRINNNTTAIATKQAILVSGVNIKTVGGNSLIGTGDVPINASQGLQSVTNIDSTTSHQIIAKTYNATSPPIFSNNTDAIAGGLRNGDFYKLPYNNGNYLLGIVVSSTNPVTPPAPSNSYALTENGTILLNENGTPIIIE